VMRARAADAVPALIEKITQSARSDSLARRLSQPPRNSSKRSKTKTPTYAGLQSRRCEASNRTRKWSCR
jgi:hypothetical protein